MTRIESRDRSRQGALALVIVLALACAMAIPGSAAAKSGQQHSQPKQHKSKPKPLYWGAIIGPELTGTAAPWDMNAVTAFAGNAGKWPSLVGFSLPFADCTVSPCHYYSFPTTPMDSTRAFGAIPVLSWSSSTAAAPEDTLRQPAFSLRKIIDGTLDTHITEFAEEARDWGHPFFLRFNWEMNGFWFPWSEGVNGNKPGEFIKAWRHTHDIFTAVGATNATWVWCPNIALVKRLKRFRQDWPGGAYVDWTCLDGFNWGETATSAGWMSFEHIFEPAYKEVTKIAPRKPMMLGEVGSEERGGSKAKWTRNMLKAIPQRFRKIRALVWLDQKDQGMRWPIESSRSAQRAFAKGVRPSIYRPNVFGEITASPIPPPTLP